jgi:hypothetical protein
MIAHGDDKNPGAGLRDPKFSIKKHRTDLVGAVAKRLVEETKIITPICGEQTNDVFQGDDSWFNGHFVKDSKPFPKKAAARSSEASHLACQRQILAGEAGPKYIAMGNPGSANLLDRTEVEMVIAVVGGVACSLLWTDVIGPNRDASMSSALGDKAAACEKIDKGWKCSNQEFF